MVASIHGNFLQGSVAYFTLAIALALLSLLLVIFVVQLRDDAKDGETTAPRAEAKPPMQELSHKSGSSVTPEEESRQAEAASFSHVADGTLKSASTGGKAVLEMVAVNGGNKIGVSLAVAVYSVDGGSLVILSLCAARDGSVVKTASNEAVWRAEGATAVKVTAVDEPFLGLEDATAVQQTETKTPLIPPVVAGSDGML